MAVSKSSLYINFIDFEKAFDSISINVLLRLLRHHGMPDTIISSQVVHKLWTEDSTIEYEDLGKTRLPVISLAVSGCPGLSDEDSL